jgi:hypothetical protein
MHDGSFASLEDVAKFIPRAVGPNPSMDREIRGTSLKTSNWREADPSVSASYVIM